MIQLKKLDVQEKLPDGLASRSSPEFKKFLNSFSDTETASNCPDAKATSSER
jgi:hypothetical protein